jgi:AcrR family transcriptional regulator
VAYLARPEVTEQQKKVKREAILKAALDVFAEKGYHAAGIADIATRLDVGHGTIYRYFKNKLDIFLTLFDALNADFLKIAWGTRPDLATTPEEYIGVMQKFCLDFSQIFLREISHIRIFFEEIHADPEIRRRFEAAQLEFDKTSERFLTIGRDKGFVRPEIHIPSAARLLNAMIYDTMRAATETESASSNLLLLATTLIDVFTKGAMPKPG